MEVRFHPVPRAIQITPIYDTTPSNPEIRDFNQSSSTRSNGPLIVNRNSQIIDPNRARYQPEASSNSRPGDRPYAYSPTRDQGYDSDPSYYPRGRYSRSHPRDRSGRRSSDYDDSSDYAPRHDDSSDYDRDSPDYDRPSSNYDRPSSNYDHPSSDYNRSPPRHQKRSLSKPYSKTHHKPERLTHTPRILTAWQRYLEGNRQAAHRDPFAHLKACSEEMQRVLKAIPPSPHFCWSECTGRRKAVCVEHLFFFLRIYLYLSNPTLQVGINYVGQKNELKGCANDARHMSSFLISK